MLATRSVLWYAPGMSLAKRKVSVSVEADPTAELERRQRHRALVELLDKLDEEHGPVDEVLVEKYVGLLR